MFTQRKERMFRGSDVILVLVCHSVYHVKVRTRALKKENQISNFY